MGLRLSSKGSVYAALTAGVAILIVAAVLRVHGTLHPPRRSDAPPDTDALHLDLEEVSFNSVDGVPLRGWHIPGDPGVPAILLCHDLGAARTSLLGLALDLSRAGFPLLLFDFRGHGASGGDGSTLGLEEKRDVLGAVDFLASRKEYRGRSFGVFGVGMGAHAAVLAAADRRSIRVLVLDGLYPDPSFELVRRVYSGWQPGVRRLGFVPETIFLLMAGARADGERAADVVHRLTGRDLLLLAPEGDPELGVEIQRMYESIPEQMYVDGNLELLPATHSEGVYGENRRLHHGSVEEFFVSRLGHEAIETAASTPNREPNDEGRN
jgi:pimeloyl-ACP methyl ester carboxylesterase